MLMISGNFQRAMILIALLCAPLPLQAQFGNLLQQLQNRVKPPNQQNTPGASRQGSGPVPSNFWCSRQERVMKGLNLDTGVIEKEFKIADLEGLQTDFLKEIGKGWSAKDNRQKARITQTFPSAEFFSASFETEKVRLVYDTFLAWPEPATLAALIHISRGSDWQESADAYMALAFLQLQAPNLSIHPNRWQENVEAASRAEHFTALVFKARMATYGEHGSKDIRQAMSYLANAGELKSKYGQSDGPGSGKEFDVENYNTVHTDTLKHIYFNEPGMPYRKLYDALAKNASQIEQAQEDFKRRFPGTRLGMMYADAVRNNKEALEIGSKIVDKSGGANVMAGSKASLESARGDSGRVTIQDRDPQLEAEQIKLFSNLSSVDDVQKEMLARAHEKRLIAQGIIFQSYSGLLTTLMSGFGDMVKMAAPLPALSQANSSLIQSCIVSAKWDQAMRAKGVPKVDPKAAEAGVHALTMKYKD